MFEWNLGHHFLVHELIFNGLHDSSYTSTCYLLIHSFLHLYNIKSCMPTLLLPIPSDSVIFFLYSTLGLFPLFFFLSPSWKQNIFLHWVFEKRIYPHAYACSWNFSVLLYCSLLGSRVFCCLCEEECLLIQCIVSSDFFFPGH